MADSAPAIRRDPTWLATGVLWTLGASMVMWLMAMVAVPPGPAFLIPLVFAGTVFAAIAGVWFSPQPITARTATLPAIMGVFAGLAPVALVLFFRLSVEMCTVVNVFGLPWSEPWRDVAHIGSGIVWFFSCLLIVLGFALDRGLRRPAIAMMAWSAMAIVPAFLLFFITVYGDPAPGCVVT
ncbi:hypothetical protein [Microcella sp.]|uniref:hypothetical protein n=1 Tax=Microcella sp. TaxID=1913979 RepID=UPI00256A9051|nr:hypothetical protein [Microcella sp.]MBX9471266.1 hypothetical protein [Microcella sp.]